MTVRFDHLGAELAAARSAAAAAGRAAKLARERFERALEMGGDVERLAEDHRTAHRIHVDARDDLAELEALMPAEALAA